jgi:hypothetical protein
MTDTALVLADPDQTLIDDGIAACVEELDAVQASRARWVRIGNGLAAGRRKYTSDKLYGQWIKTTPFARLSKTSRVDALSLHRLQNSGCSLAVLPEDLGHPTNVLQWLRDQDQAAPVNPSPTLDPEMAVAGEVLKHHRRYKAALDHAKGTGPEADNAKRQVKATAKKLGITEEVLERLVDKLDPYGKLLPANRDGLKRFMDDVLDFTKHLKQTVTTYKGAVTPEFLIAVIASELRG